jgi:hypothetical protein
MASICERGGCGDDILLYDGIAGECDTVEVDRVGCWFNGVEFDCFCTYLI